MRKSLTAQILCATVLLAATGLQAAPAPSLAPVSWELKFRFQDPQRVSVYVPGQAQPVVYWYMLYRIENLSRQEVEFYPQFDLVTDRLEVVKSELTVSPEAFQAIFRRANNTLLLPPHKVTGKLQRGQDRARHGVAIWRDFDAKARSFTVYVSGLSGETKRVKNPTFDPDKPEDEKNRRYYTFRKTLAVPYAFPGSKQTRTRVKPERVPNGQKWIMR
jgi:hypothetical protein